MTHQLGIDLHPLLYTLTGIGAYLQQLVQQISCIDHDLKWVFPLKTELPSRRLIGQLLCRNLDRKFASRIRVEPEFSLLFNRRRQHLPDSVLSGKGYGLFHVTNATCQYDQFSMPHVITVYDLAWLRVSPAHYRRPQIFGLERLENLVRSAAQVLCISECTRRDVIELLEVPEDRVRTTPLAPRPDFFAPPQETDGEQGDSLRQACRQRWTRGRRFFFALSTVEPRKNYVRLIRAFSKLQGAGCDFLLLIAGAKRSAWPEVCRCIQECGVADSVRMLGHTSDRQARELMWGCEALVYPSLYEGFGLPPLEAMACGTPVIASNAGALPEVIGDTAEMVDPLDEDALVAAMEHRWKQGPVTPRERQRYLDRASIFTWDKTARATLNAYKEVLNA